MSKFAPQGSHGLLLEAEVPPGQQAAFQHRYRAATGLVIMPGSTRHYLNQPNKWAAELRVYFNDPGMAVSLAVCRIAFEHRSSGYLSGSYRYRINNNDFWWELVERHGMRLGRS
jgi:hypothetical protein